MENGGNSTEIVGGRGYMEGAERVWIGDAYSQVNEQNSVYSHTPAIK